MGNETEMEWPDLERLIPHIAYVYVKDEYFKLRSIECRDCGKFYTSMNTYVSRHTKCRYTQHSMEDIVSGVIHTIVLKNTKYYRWGEKGIIYDNIEDAQRQARVAKKYGKQSVLLKGKQNEVLEEKDNDDPDT